MTTFPIRQKLVEIARRNVGKTEDSKNQAPWIKPLWAATEYPSGMESRQPYCAAGVAWAVRQWLKIPDVLHALNLTPEKAEAWRCKSSSCFRAGQGSWEGWAKARGLTISKYDELHAGDLIIYSFSHIEIYVTDLADGRMTCIGYNTNAAGSRDGEGCFEKPRSRSQIRTVIRMLP